MKKITVFLICLITFTGVFAQHREISRDFNSVNPAIQSNASTEKNSNLVDNAIVSPTPAPLASFPRKVVLEEFSTEKCPNCPPSAAYVHSLAVANPGLIVMVHHAGYYTDGYTIPANTAALAMFNAGGSTYAPAAMIDRFFWGGGDIDGDGTPEKGPVYWPGDGKELYSGTLYNKRKVVPANVSVGISGSYNATTKQLTATVSGSFSANFTNVGVSLWITEDNITTTNQAGYSGTFTHHDLIRAVISSQWGDPLTGTTSGGTYSKTYNFTIPSTWVVSNLSLVGFVSQIDANNVNNRQIHNAEEVKLSSLTTGTNDLSLDNKIQIYPNPSTGDVFVNMSAFDLGNVNVKVVNVLGEVVSETNTNTSVSKELKLNLNAQPNGLYFVKVKTDNGMAVQNVILNK